jgi:hypothetical protein
VNVVNQVTKVVADKTAHPVLQDLKEMLVCPDRLEPPVHLESLVWMVQKVLEENKVHQALEVLKERKVMLERMEHLVHLVKMELLVL